MKFVPQTEEGETLLGRFITCCIIVALYESAGVGNQPHRH